MKNQKNDQLVIPISMVEGMALRAVAEAYDVTMASLIRSLIRDGLAKNEDIKALYEIRLAEFQKLTPLQLLQAKSGIPKTHQIKITQ